MSAAPYDELNLGGGIGDDPIAVSDNRRRTAAALGLDPDRVVWMRQTHSNDVAHVDEPKTRPPVVDAMVTTVPGLALGVLVADCSPVLAADPVARVVGVAHAGRLGLARGVVPELVSRMCGLGARADRLVTVLGPTVCGQCYEVPEQMRAEVAARVPAAWCETGHGTPGLDIPAGIVAQLEGLGVKDIQRDPRCTVESREVYSYRRDGRTGRFAGYVWLES